MDFGCESNHCLQDHRTRQGWRLWGDASRQSFDWVLCGHANQTLHNSMLRKWKSRAQKIQILCTQKIKILCSKMEIMCSELHIWHSKPAKALQTDLPEFYAQKMEDLHIENGNSAFRKGKFSSYHGSWLFHDFPSNSTFKSTFCTKFCDRGTLEGRTNALLPPGNTWPCWLMVTVFSLNLIW